MVDAALTEYLPHGINATVLPSSNKYEIMAAVDLRRLHFQLPWTGGTPRAITKQWECSVQDRPPSCAKCQQNLFSSFGADPSQTDRHTHTQTANLISPITVAEIIVKQLSYHQYNYMAMYF